MNLDRRLLAAAMAMGLLCACEGTPSTPSWTILYACPAQGAAAQSVVVEIREGGCEGSSVYDDVVTRTEDAAAPERLGQGRYGFFARALDVDGDPIVEDCMEQTLPTDTIEITLGKDCDGGVPDDAGKDGGIGLDGSMDASVMPDSSLDSGSDAGMRDGAPDAAPDAVIDTGPPEPCFVYVLSGGAGNGNGDSWANAMASPADAVVKAASGQCEVWIGTGRYFIYRDDADNTVQMQIGVDVYGGFLGTETEREQRDPKALHSILDGCDTPAPCFNRVHHVVSGGPALQGVQLDGFHIVNGNADGSSSDDSGGGVFSVGGSMTVRGCTIENNIASDRGGGIYFSTGALVVDDCILRNNTAQRGGGIGLENSTVALDDLEFHGNAAAGSSSSYGGGIYVDEVGGLARNLLFTGNRTQGEGGAIGTGSNATITFSHCTVSGNSTTDAYAAVGGLGADIQMTNSILWGNGLDAVQTSSFNEIRHSIVENGVAGSIEGTRVLTDTPLFVGGGSTPYALSIGSTAIDAANGDESTDQDLEGNFRIDDQFKPNTGTGTPDYADMGAYERQP